LENISEGVSKMKKVLLIAAVALGISLMTSGKASAQFYSGEYMGGAVATGMLGPNPFTSMGTGYRAAFPGLFAATSLASMGAGMMESAAAEFGDSMTFGMSPMAASMGKDMKLTPIKLGASALRQEFALLDRRTAVDLASQVAAGPAKTWAALSAKELSSLGVDASLGSLSGF
jgi:hypothetical protein